MDGSGFQRREREFPNSNPSFSSTLLDAIYRSIDGGEEEEDLVPYKDTMRKKQSNYSVLKGSCKNGAFLGADTDDAAGFRRACMIEKWMEHKVSEQVVVRRKSAAEVERKLTIWNSSSSGSSDSSCGGVFSSSEAESVYGVSSGSSCYGLNRTKPKPGRTGKDLSSHDHHYPQQVKTKKSRALKIYGDLKKVKQPISPGGRLASFLNSLFTAKKAKISSGSDEDRKVKSANASTCSSASSLSRSCLSKNITPSSTARAAGKRSVRFFPVSVIVDEDSRPCGHKNLDLSVKEELQLHISEKNRRVEEAARDLLRNYQKKVEREFDLRNGNVIKNLKVFENVEDDDDDDDDAASYASSDLFELDNLSAIGMERYSEELPVYETTHLDTNRAIANGLIL